ncbi:MAG: nitroreductase family protein [Candidatus Electryonea clarkiae]|nr:nitroreductase family protein [Candidatus Electryonea clarkiae]MDP8286752.1 nitroreductase family protein [Candidatus Electryonea clarkiae]
MTVTEAIHTRRSVHSYDPSKKISDEELEKLITLSTLAPSSFNLNHWRFITVKSPEGKEKLHAASLNQKHLLDASAVLIVLGKIDAHEDIDLFTEDWISKGYYPDDTHLKVVAEKFYGTRPEIQRDEAIRSTSIMTGVMMLAAVEMGLSTAAVIGFHADKVMEDFHIPENYVPVMLLTVGYELNPMPERVKRLAVSDIAYDEDFGRIFSA